MKQLEHIHDELRKRKVGDTYINNTNSGSKDKIEKILTELKMITWEITQIKKHLRNLSTPSQNVVPLGDSNFLEEKTPNFIPNVDVSNMSINVKSDEGKTIKETSEISSAVNALNKGESNVNQLCDYGCKRKAIKKFANNRWCCSEKYHQCPAWIPPNKKT